MVNEGCCIYWNVSATRTQSETRPCSWYEPQPVMQPCMTEIYLQFRWVHYENAVRDASVFVVRAAVIFDTRANPSSRSHGMCMRCLLFCAATCGRVSHQRGAPQPKLLRFGHHGAQNARPASSTRLGWRHVEIAISVLRRPIQNSSCTCWPRQPPSWSGGRVACARRPRRQAARRQLGKACTSSGAGCLRSAPSDWRSIATYAMRRRGGRAPPWETRRPRLIGPSTN